MSQKKRMTENPSSFFQNINKKLFPQSNFLNDIAIV
jgi:hypothetical protein